MLRRDTLPAAVISRSRTVPAVLAVLIAGLLGTGGWAVTDRRSDGGRVLDPSAAAVVADLKAFVELARGLRFLEPVDVAVLTDAAFRRALSGADPLEEPEGEVEAGVLRALGLIGPDDDLGPAGELDAGTVAGFYDTETKELVVRGPELTPFVRQVLVHELTHALDDQHFDLDPDLADEEAALAFEALVEGNAVAVELRYLESRAPAERREARAEEEATFGGGDGGGIPDALLDLAEFPYARGPDLVAAILASGGQARLDAAFRTPPTTSAEVLHPERFLSGRGRARVPAVAAGGRIVDDGVLGELVLRLILAQSRPVAQAVRAAEGWAGDRYVAWAAGSRTCVRATVVVDSDVDVAELAGALRQWAGATVDTGPRAVTFSRCA